MRTIILGYKTYVDYFGLIMTWSEYREMLEAQA
jgi:hypothetical protein